MVAVGNCAVVRWTRDDSLGANRANNMFLVAEDEGVEGGVEGGSED